MRRCKSGFAFVDLLRMGAAGMMLGAFIILGLAAAQERSNRIKCAWNLRQIGQGMSLYAKDANTYPRVRYDPKPGAKMHFFTGVKARDPFGKTRPEPNDVTAAAFLLMRAMDFAPDIFLCPSAPRIVPGQPLKKWKEAGAFTLLDVSNFLDIDGLDYSIAQPYPDEDAVKLGYRWNTNVSPEWAIAADLNPGGAELLKLKSDSPGIEMRKGNSPNHGAAGQNVLYNDGHVEWRSNAFAGHKKDNIYTRAKVKREVGDLAQMEPAESERGWQPSYALDSIMVPTAEQAPRKPQVVAQN